MRAHTTPPDAMSARDRRDTPGAPGAAAGPGTPHVVIVGAGFGGLYAARALAGKPVRVTVIDRHNYHLFTPLLYQVATAALSPGEIAQPIRSILRHRNVDVLMAEVTGVDLAARRVRLNSDSARELTYDYLILAAGARTAYFGHEEWAQLAPGLKTIDDALEIRRRILSVYEAADREPDPAARAALLTFVVVGGGPTGVELAGGIAETARHTLRHEYRSIDPAAAREETMMTAMTGGASRAAPAAVDSTGPQGGGPRADAPGHEGEE